MMKSCNMKKRGMVKFSLIFLVMSCVVFSVNRFLMSVEATSVTVNADTAVQLDVGDVATFACASPGTTKILTYTTDGTATESGTAIDITTGTVTCTQEISDNLAYAPLASQFTDTTTNIKYAFLTNLYKCATATTGRLLCAMGDIPTQPNTTSNAFGFSFPNSFLLSVAMLFSVASFAIFF